MKKELILKKAIEKAVKNGWVSTVRYGAGMKLHSSCDVTILTYQSDDPLYTTVYKWNINKVLFDRNFAKAFWGEKIYCCPVCKSEKVDQYLGGKIRYRCKNKECGNTFNEIKIYKGWRYHIQKLVLSKDRLEYISKFI